MDVRSGNRDISSKRADSCKEVAEEYKDAVKFNQETDQRPSEEDKEYTGGESSCALNLLSSRKKDEGLLQSNN